MEHTAASCWDNEVTYRAQFLDRAIECSALTIPSLIPQSDRSKGMRNQMLDSLYQGAGARGVNNLAAKLLLALYPPNQPFFRLALDKQRLNKYLEEQGQQGGDAEALAGQIDEGLAQTERTLLVKMDQMALRSTLFETLKHLIVGGNGLLYVGDPAVRFYGLRSFVIKRDPEGEWTEIVIKEEVSEEFLPPGAPRGPRTSPFNAGTEDAENEFHDVYTYIERDPSDNAAEAVTWHQELNGKKIPRSAGFSPIDTCPWIPLRLHRVAGESYGRGLVEEVLGDLRSLESLSQAIVEGSLIQAQCKILVNPNGVTRADVLAKSANGAVVPGNPNDVAMLSLDKSRDFAVALQCMQLIERRLQFTFLLNEAMQRDAERVTAEEVRQMAEQLEQTLGGIYSVLSQEMQQPLIRRVVALMERSGDIPKMPGEFISPEITTGLDAIGRGNDRARLTQFLQTIAAALGPEAILRYVNPTELMTRFAASDGIDTKGLIKTQQQLADEQAIAQKVQLEQQLAQSAISGQGQPGGGGNGAGAPVAPGPAQGPGPGAQG
jgi:hypothetical protein